MPINPNLALQSGLYTALVSDSPLTTLLGGSHVFDHLPRGQQYPYVVIGTLSSRDYSTGTEISDEHFVTLYTWSRSQGKTQVYEIMDAIKRVLHDSPLNLTDHHLVQMRQVSTEVKFDKVSYAYLGTIRLRAVTEPL